MRFLTSTLAGLAAVVMAGAGWALQAGAAASPAPPRIIVIPFEESIHPVTAEYVLEGLHEADRSGAALVLIELDTPGGRVDAMEEIVDAITSSRVPVAVWVGPTGAHAASAGFFVLLASDAPLMAPGTRTGAAHPIFSGGDGDDPNTGILLDKVTEDLAASVRTLATHRGKDPEVCEQVVRESKAWTEAESLEKGLIMGVTASREAAIAFLDGRTIRRFDGTEETLTLQGAVLEIRRMTLRQRFLGLLAEPTVLALLFMLGLAGIGIEAKAPGAFYPGILGGCFLLLFALGATLVPLRILGLLLMVVGIGMLILEVKVVSHGALTVGGVICVLAGAITLVDQVKAPGMQVSLPVLLPPLLVTAAFILAGVLAVTRARRAQVMTGKEGLAGELARVVVELAPRGRVKLRGELWEAHLAPGTGPVEVGAEVRVVRAEGLVLHVERQGPA